MLNEDVVTGVCVEHQLGAELLRQVTLGRDVGAEGQRSEVGVLGPSFPAVTARCSRTARRW